MFWILYGKHYDKENGKLIDKIIAAIQKEMFKSKQNP